MTVAETNEILSRLDRLEAKIDRVLSDWVTVPEAAEILGVSEQTVTRYLREPEIPLNGVKTPGGRTWKIRRADLEAFIAESET
ncbi:MAG: hypothetical protein AMXMBFR84_26430 [Candidatus Hydrogenedentota bacterium]